MKSPEAEGSVTENDVEAIKKLKARYFRTMDTKEWSDMRQVFTNDAVVDTSASGGQIFTGADEFLAFLQPLLQDAITVHHGHMPEIEITSSSTARGIWALQDLIIWPDGTRLQGYGHYHETYKMVENDWKIWTLTLTRLHLDVTSPSR
jgi:SnoaL-like domain